MKEGGSGQYEGEGEGKSSNQKCPECIILEIKKTHEYLEYVP